MKKRGFTLIELLVVIAIIALLLSVIVPSLQKAKDYAKRTLCMSNARQAGIGLRVYGQSNDDELIPIRNQDGVIENFMPLAWEAVIAYSPTYTDSAGMGLPMNLAVLYDLGLIENPEVFYCPSQPRNGDYPIPYYYDFYTDEGAKEWGSFFPVPPNAGGGHVWVRTSYNYWTYGKKRMTQFHATKPLIVDNLQEWEVLPHRKGNISPSLSAGVPNPAAVPQGVTAVFADGHVSFSMGSDLFTTRMSDPAKYLWPLANDFYNGPGNSRTRDAERPDGTLAQDAYFLRILRTIQGHQ